MFGYINVNRKELSKEDEEIYQAYYCGLCRQLKDTAGVKGQMLLNYDMAFLILLQTGLYELENEEITFNCVIHPTGRKLAYINEATAYAADMDILLSYHNFMDDYRDDGSRTKQLLASVLKKDCERIRGKYPRQVQAVEDYMRRLGEAQTRNEKNLDIVSGYTGEMLGELFVWIEDIWAKELRNMGFYMGKFIYLMDAYDDLEKDTRKGSYNPLRYLKRQSGKDYETFCRQTFTSLMSECAKSFERMPILLHSEIIRNILYSGVWTRYEYLQLKRRRDREKEQERTSKKSGGQATLAKEHR